MPDVVQLEVLRRTESDHVGVFVPIIGVVIAPVGSRGRHVQGLTVQPHVVRARGGEGAVPRGQRSGQADEIGVDRPNVD